MVFIIPSSVSDRGRYKFFIIVFIPHIVTIIPLYVVDLIVSKAILPLLLLVGPFNILPEEITIKLN